MNVVPVLEYAVRLVFDFGKMWIFQRNLTEIFKLF